MEPRTTPTKPGTHNVQPRLSPHDPLDKHHQVKRAQENNDFRKLESERRVVLREKSAEEIERAIRTYTRRLCPKWGDRLEDTHSRRVKLDACPGCDGI